MLLASTWRLLVATLPTRPAAARMRLWRGTKAIGCAALRDGAWLLPDAAAAALMPLAEEVIGAGGAAEVLQVNTTDDQTLRFQALFDRSAEYVGLLAAIHAAQERSDPKLVESLRRQFKAVAAIDFFPGEAQRQVADALAELASAASGEPRAGSGDIRRLKTADYQGRTWATRRHLWVDRMASAWLIRRFIDRKARFLWLDNAKKCPRSALGFDYDGAAFSHVDGRVTFEVLAASFGLDDDPAIARIAAIVHCLDVGGVPVPEAPGIEAVLAGLRDAADDDKLLTETNRVFNGLYKHYRQEHRDD